MLPFLPPLYLILLILFIAICILLYKCIENSSPKISSESMRYVIPNRARQRDYQNPTTNPRIKYVKRTTRYRSYFSDSDFQDESSDFTNKTPTKVTSNIENEKGGFHYNADDENDSKKEHSPVLPPN